MKKKYGINIVNICEYSIFININTNLYFHNSSAQNLLIGFTSQKIR